MSLARTALRLAVIEALNADPVIATLCAGRVYDSLIQEFDAAQPVPMIVVATEEDGGKAFNSQNGGVPFEETCELLFEIAVRQVVEGDEGEDAQLATPQTDAELEACIDLLEYAALNAVTVGQTAQARLVRKVVTRRASKFTSARFASDATGVKLAVREVRLTVELKGEGTVLPPEAGTPYAALPDPLRTVCQAMPPGSSGEATCQMIANTITPPQDVPFQGFFAQLAVKRPQDRGRPPLRPADPNNADPISISVRPTEPTCANS